MLDVKQRLEAMKTELRRKQRRANIPQQYRNACLSHIDGDVGDQLNDYVDRFDKRSTKHGLYLRGDIGCGKTYAMCAIANNLLSRGLSPLCYNLTSLMIEMRNAYNAPGEVMSELWYKLKNRTVVLFDDLGIGKETDWVNETFYAIVNHRHDAGLPTIYTSNMSLDDLEQHYMPQIASRIAGTTTQVAFIGKDKRLG